jgi:hypothetical protein
MRKARPSASRTTGVADRDAIDAALSSSRCLPAATAGLLGEEVDGHRATGSHEPRRADTQQEIPALGLRRSTCTIAVTVTALDLVPRTVAM